MLSVAPTYPAVEAMCAIMLSLFAFPGIGVGSSAKTAAVGVGRPTLRMYSGGWRGNRDIPRPSGNDLSMDQNNPLPALTQDELRVRAWAEVREPLELQLAPLGWRALA